MLAVAGEFPGESVAARRATPESEAPPATIKHKVETTIDKCEGYPILRDGEWFSGGDGTTSRLQNFQVRLKNSTVYRLARYIDILVKFIMVLQKYFVKLLTDLSSIISRVGL
jgi:hypothetical protein